MTDHYRMNPAEDMILPGDELEEGMMVLAENSTDRSPYKYDGDGKYREEFRKVTRLRSANHLVTFLGEWADGYQETHRYSDSHTWLVKKLKAGVTYEISDPGDAEFLERFRRLYPQLEHIADMHLFQRSPRRIP